MSIHYMKQSGIRLFLVCKIGILIGILPASSQTKDEILTLIWQGMGGKQSWADARYFMFSCNSNLPKTLPGTHTYIWDTTTGNCRFDGLSARDEKLTVLFNTKNKTGHAFINNQPLAADSLPSVLQAVIQSFFNDSFWLFVPQTLINPAQLTIQEPQLIGAARYYVVEWNTPQINADIHRSKWFVDTNTGKIFQWQALSDNQTTLYNFLCSDYKDVGGGLMLATTFRDPKTEFFITYPIVSALINVESEKFLKP